MMKQLFFLCLLLILTGCTESSFEGNHSISGNEEFYATIEGTDSRTYVDEQIRMRWNAEDKITIFKKNTYNRTFMFTGNTGANAGGFRQISTDDDYWFGYDVDYSYAVYPHSAENTLDETNLYLTVNMPTEQTYAENSFGLNTNTMVAISDNNQLIFKNVGSYLRIRLYGENVAVSSITLTTKGNEAIAGKAKITPSMEGNPSCKMIGTGKSICLTCTEPVTISSDVNTPTDFWIVVPPITLASGFTITVKDNMGSTHMYEVNQSFTFERNKYYDMTRKVEIKSDIPYVTFTANEIQSFTMSQAVNTLEYSVNDSEWTELGTNIVIFGGDNGILKLRGKNLKGTAYADNIYSQVIFGNATPVACTGDIRTLLDYENYSTVKTSSAKFCRLFSDCSSLITAPKLYAMDLSSCCYESMFSGCSSLTKAPELPATTLAYHCYRFMFNYCSSLTEAPELPAITLATECYSHMFSGCSSLTEAPELPAITLATECYSHMFSGCSSLTKAPQLPATMLATECYKNMFDACSNLTKAPKLPATTLATECYSHMFYRCENLTEVPELPAMILTNSCYKNMFGGCNNLTKTPVLPATYLAESCYNYMFYDCDGLKEVPQLPAMILAKSCYEYMFNNCDSITKVSQLPAITLAPSCYSRMFYNCKNLTEVSNLPATTLANYCYYEMFYNCSKLNSIIMLATEIGEERSLDNWLYGVSSTGTFTKAKGMESLPTGSSGIPSGWTIVDYEK